MPSYTKDPGLHKGDASIDIIGLERERNVELSPLSTPSKAQFYDSLPVSASDRTIRVLELESATESPGSQLVGRLRVVSLKDSPQISALSYVWGPLSEPNPDVLRIRLDNGGHIDLNITANCASALKDLTSIFGSLNIWVDAISINQDDDEEKASQILLMEEIYTWAKVYVWLGSRSDASARTFQRYRALSERGKTKHWLSLVALASNPTADMRDKAKRSLIHDVLQKRIRNPSFPSSPNTPVIVIMIMFFFRELIWPIAEILFIVISPLYKLSRCVLACARPELVLSSLPGRQHDVDDVLSRPWFYRGWTFQEILLPMDIILVCGTDFLSWDFLVRGLQYDIYDRESDISESSASVANFLRLVSIWVNIPRQTSWNEETMRMTVDNQNPTIENYYSHGARLTRSLECALIFLLIRGHCDTTYHLAIPLLPIAILIAAVATPVYANPTPLAISLGVPGVVIAKAILTIALDFLTSALTKERQIVNPIEEDFGITVAQTKPVYGIIDALRTRQTSDPKDRAFANYAILASLGVKPRKPDYRKELGLIYQECFVNLLQWEPGILNLITEIGTTPLRGTASWVPHWHAAASTAWIGVPEINDTVADEILAEISSDQSTCLVVSGQVLGRVQNCSGKFTSIDLNGNALVSLPSMDWSQWAEPTKESFLVSSLKLADWIEFIRYNSAYEDPIPSIIEHVLCLQYTYSPDHFVPPEPVNIAEKPAFRALHNRMIKVSTTTLESAKSRGPLPLLDTEFHRNILPPQEQDSDDNRKVREQVLMINELLAGQRSLFVTDNGYVGCGAETMQYNDHIFWISGVSVPMILRPRCDANSEAEYTVIGPAFIYKPPDRSGTKQRIRLY
ncbi:heterokaryon incompatibility protein-domain-containing protein [Xylaria curta]|nr:heterokaryon incompatibility protein-domain-containing protein [Xylaria curta]